jgi:hypothetical protein
MPAQLIHLNASRTHAAVLNHCDVALITIYHCARRKALEREEVVEEEHANQTYLQVKQIPAYSL